MQIQIASSLKPLFSPRRYKIFFGGRGGTKSWGIAQALVIIGAQKPTRILCTRELQGSIRESVHRLLSDTISRLGLDDFYDITLTTITGKNGTSIIFEGLKNNTTKIKSMEGIDIAWCEEAEAITEYSWDLLIPTIRTPGSEIWVSFNPFDEMDATYQRFVAPYEADLLKHGHASTDDVYVAKVGFEDNPWFPDELRAEMERCKADDPKKYRHIWLGEPNTDYEDSVIQPEWVDAAIDAHTKLNFPVRGLKVIGYDVADTGRDAKAMTMRQGSVVQSVQSWTKGDMEQATEKVYDYAIANKVNTIVYDNIGVGAGVKMKFRQLNNQAQFLAIEGFSGSEMPSVGKYKGDRSAQDVFRNARAERWWLLRDRFEATYRAVVNDEYIDPEELISLDSSIPELKMLKAELVRVQRKHGRTHDSLIQIESKQDMKARGLSSPDLADSLVYAFSNKPSKAVYNKRRRLPQQVNRIM